MPLTGRAKYEYMKVYRASQPKNWRRVAYLRQTYGLTEKDVKAMFVRQKGKCAICRKRSKRKLHVDHNHKTGRIRGLLCFRCNAFVGLAGDLPRVLKQAVKYLRGS